MLEFLPVCPRFLLEAALPLPGSCSRVVPPGKRSASRGCSQTQPSDARQGLSSAPGSTCKLGKPRHSLA